MIQIGRLIGDMELLMIPIKIERIERKTTSSVNGAKQCQQTHVTQFDPQRKEREFTNS